MTNLTQKFLFYNKFYYIPVHVSSTIVLIIRRSKLHYTAFSIITLKNVCVMTPDAVQCNFHVQMMST